MANAKCRRSILLMANAIPYGIVYHMYLPPPSACKTAGYK